MTFKQYHYRTIMEIPETSKVLIPLSFTETLEESVKLTSLPFFHYFDDVRQLHFSYFLDFQNNQDEILKFPYLVNYLVKNQVSINQRFASACGWSEISFLLGDIKYKSQPTKTEFITSFIDKQINDSASKDINGLHNPIVILPFMIVGYEKFIIEYCKSRLVNLVIFDFISFSLSQVNNENSIKPQSNARLHCHKLLEKYKD